MLFSPREDSDAEEDLLTLKARSESLSSGLLLWELPGDVEGGLGCIVPGCKDKDTNEEGCGDAE